MQTDLGPSQLKVGTPSGSSPTQLSAGTETPLQNSGDLNVVVTVRDSGIGLDPATREQTFTAFHTTKPSGLGMGLSISRSIVEITAGGFGWRRMKVPGPAFPSRFHRTHPKAGRMFSHERTAPLCDRDAPGGWRICAGTEPCKAQVETIRLKVLKMAPLSCTTRAASGSCSPAPTLTNSSLPRSSHA